MHPSFTEAEAALRAAGTPVTQVMRGAEDWALDPQQVPEDADLVVLANPNNPTGNLDPPARLARLARPGRTLVVDESFIDFVPGEQSSLARQRELPGLVVLRSLTKVWGLAGLRAGYLLGPRELVERLAAHRQPWSVSAPALAAIETCVPDRATAIQIAGQAAAARRDLHERLARIPGVRSWRAEANFVLVRVPGRGRALVARLARDRIAVRPCDSFPGLGSDHIRLAVRTPSQHAVLAARSRGHSSACESMTDADRFTRPPTPPGFDSSRASQRAGDPRGWRYPDAQREVVHRVIAERRDIRRFRAGRGARRCPVAGARSPPTAPPRSASCSPGG